MKRYYLSEIIGDGTEFNPYRTAIADMGVNHVAVITCDPVTGKPIKSVALCLVNTPDHTKLEKKDKIHSLPDFPLDGKLNAINATAKNKMLETMQQYGIPTESISSADGYRDAIRLVGQYMHPEFNENNFDILD